MTIEVANESGVGVDELASVSVSRFVLAEMGINPLAELSILLMDVDAMTDLHVKWMDEPGPTDVMSFPMDELDTARRPDEAGPGPALLGDVVLCPAVAADRPAQAGHTLDDELHLLTVHGVLHLLGYDHAEPAEEREMFRLQNELLDGWRTRRRLPGRLAAATCSAGTVGLAVATSSPAAVALTAVDALTSPARRPPRWSRRGCRRRRRRDHHGVAGPGGGDSTGKVGAAPPRCWRSPGPAPVHQPAAAAADRRRADRDRAGRRGRAVAPGGSSSGWRSWWSSSCWWSATW